MEGTLSGTSALSQTRAANFWRKIYSWGRGRLDVEIVCGGLHAHDWVWTGRDRNYMKLLELCENEFLDLPVQSASKVRYTVAAMAGAVATNANCPRCRKGTLYVETDVYGESRRCLICGYRD